MTGARLAAAQALLAVASGRTTLAAALERARAPLADRRDRALLVELATGSLRWRNEIDAVIESASRRPAASIDRGALAVLRLGVYQLRHLERVPAHAVVHESVEVVRALGAMRAVGFVNAVLRTVARGDRPARLPARPEPAAASSRWVEYLSVTLSHPAWLVERWLARYGPDAAEGWCAFNNASPSVVVRPIDATSSAGLVRRLQEHGIEAVPGTLIGDAIRLPPGALSRVPATLAAEFVVQDEGSQLVAAVAGVSPGERVLDVCAAPGGKTLVMARDLDVAAGRPMSLVAADRRPRRVALLSRTLRRAGMAVPVVALDATAPLPFGPVFDCVLLDAPCSGLGTLRRDPDLKWSRDPGDLPGLAASQRRMLAAAADAVRPGGRLVYATCSSEPDENAQVIDAFLESDGRYAPAPVPDRIPRAVIDARGCVTTVPFRDNQDAYFAAVLARRAGT